MKKSQVGFTIVEVLVAIIILGVGISAMAGSAAMVTRMIGEGKQATRMASVASQRMEALRLAAYSTVPRCTAVGFSSGGPATSAEITESWIVPAGGDLRSVSVVVSRPTARGSRSTFLRSEIAC